MDQDKLNGILIITVGLLIVILSFVHCRGTRVLVEDALEKCKTEDCRQDLLKEYFSRELKVE